MRSYDIHYNTSTKKLYKSLFFHEQKYFDPYLNPNIKAAKNICLN